LHIDREACEFSVTVTLGYRYVGKPPNFKWPIGFVENIENIENIEMNSMRDNETKWLECDSGDAIIYKGCEIPHMREPLICEEGSFHVQVFLHYVDADGPYAETCKYDQRQSIGIKKEII
jgi:hypothetical protein